MPPVSGGGVIFEWFVLVALGTQDGMIGIVFELDLDTLSVEIEVNVCDKPVLRESKQQGVML
jgi:hypothetical protein